MYFPLGWSKVLKIPELGSSNYLQIICNRDKILFAILTSDSLSIWFCKPCVPIVSHRRSVDSTTNIGENVLVQWRPDSSRLVIVTNLGYLLFYKLDVTENQKGLYEQIDSSHANLRRDSAELYLKETVPSLTLTSINQVKLDGDITNVVCIRDELMIATTIGHVLRYSWDGVHNRDYCLDLRRIPFCIDQQVSKAIPIVEANTYIVDIEYSPLVGGFAIVLNDGRAAFLTASSLRFDPNQVQGIWAQGIEDATCSSVNHKFRLIAFGRNNSQGIVYSIDECTGGLEVSHQMILSSKDYPGSPGGIHCMKWTPDGCAMAVAWSCGGLSLWSTFGSLLMCTLGWDYGLHVDLSRCNPLLIKNIEWSAEGYQLWMLQHTQDCSNNSSVVQMDFVKSALTVNPGVSHSGHLYLQGEDRLFINLGDGATRSNHERSRHAGEGSSSFIDSMNTNGPMGSKQWIVVPIPSTYSATNWPIRYTAIDCEGENVSVAGRTGLAHYSLLTRKWKLFGNETQEKDFVVTGGLLWWKDLLIMGCYSIVDNTDELRFYPRDTRLDNVYMQSTKVSAQLLLLNVLKDRLVIFCADALITVYNLTVKDNQQYGNLEIVKMQTIDISALCVHPACVVSVTLTTLRTETGRHSNRDMESIVMNVSGKLLMVQRELTRRCDRENNLYESHSCGQPTVLASCVENVWIPRKSRRDKPHLTEALWLFCGAHGMRVWLPLFPRDADKTHTFMSKRIMLPFHLKIYPLAILFEDAILLGAENDTTLYTADSNSPFSFPFCVLERTSQVYLHQILRQLIRRNLGLHAWEIARSCTNLQHFPHSLELLLHEVLEEEATSKEPIPDALLPSVIEFIHEFPVYLQTIVQCARKTEIALWPYLFSAAGKPKELFQECMARKQLDTAASYLIILQNLEPSTVSRQYATLLLDAALEQCKWDLSKDLVRFLRAIDPNDVESPRTSFILTTKYGISAQTPQVNTNEEDLSLVLGTMQVSRSRSYSTTVTPKVQQQSEISRTNSGNSDVSRSSNMVVRRKKSVPVATTDNKEASSSAEEFFIDVILQRHARRLLSAQRLLDLGHFAAHLDFHPVSWLAREKDRAGRVDDFVAALKQLHQDFAWPYPVLNHPISHYLQRKTSNTSSSSPGISPINEEKYKLLNNIEQNIMSGTRASGVGDSGYMSNTGGHGHLTTPLVHSQSDITVEAQLMPNLHQDEGSIMSEESSQWTDDREFNMELSWNDMKSLEQLSVIVANRGTPKAEVQLRYLLQLFMEACCLEWAVIVAVLLRDAMAIFRVVNASRSVDLNVTAVQRLRDGILALLQWTNVQCLGYKPFLVTIQNQITVLNNIILFKEQQQRHLTTTSDTSPPTRRSRHTSSNQDTNVTNEQQQTDNNTDDKSNKSVKSTTCDNDKNNVEIVDNIGRNSNRPTDMITDTQSNCIVS